jgi:aconitate hydratase
LADARSIAATAAAGGHLTSAFELQPELWQRNSDPENTAPKLDTSIYEKRVYQGWGRPDVSRELIFGPNIKDWPSFPAMPENLLLKVVSFIQDDVTTTDELIPSGETSSYRSNPLRLAEFTLSRRDPSYVRKAKEAASTSAEEIAKMLAGGWGQASGGTGLTGDRSEGQVSRGTGLTGDRSHGGQVSRGTGLTLLQSAIYARKPGDGSAREQAASCQRVLGGGANFALGYATKRYRSNLINWGILPFLVEKESDIEPDEVYFFPGIRSALLGKAEKITGCRLKDKTPITVRLGPLTDEERETLAAGCLVNRYRA